MSAPTNGIRWWPAASVLIGEALLIAAIWGTGEPIRQERVMRTAVAVIAGTLLLLGWFVFLSRLAVKTRIVGLILLLALFGGVAAAVRITGFSGDVVPQLDWRWRSEPSGEEAFLRVDESGNSLPGLADYPGFLGQDRSGVLPGLPLATDWSADPPRLLWRRPVGEGWSPIAVARGAAITQEQHGSEERVVAYRAATGEILWTHSDSQKYESALAGPGPRATPTIDGDQVFTLGGTGLLNCLELTSGHRLWSVQVIEENGSSLPVWGYAPSPLVMGGKVLVAAGGVRGGTLAAYERNTGRKLWSAGSDAIGYSSPQLRQLAGVSQVLMLNHSTMAGFSPEDGQLLWDHPWPSQQPNVSQPLVIPGDRVFGSSGYGVGCKLFQISRRSEGGMRAELLWETPRLKAKFTNVVYHDGSIYGLDDGVLACLDPESGERRWKQGRYGHGQLILVGDLLLLQTETGEVVLIRPSPERLIELTRFRVFDDKSWNPPALAGRYLFLRNHREAACYELPLREES